jgi:hypothetical protein
MNKLVRASAHYRDTMGDTVDTTWRPEKLRVAPIPKIEPPILPAGMSASDRIELKALAERVGPTYGSFAITSKALDDLVAWVEAYRSRDA